MRADYYTNPALSNYTYIRHLLGFFILCALFGYPNLCPLDFLRFLWDISIMIENTAMDCIRYTEAGATWDYTPKDYVGSLDYFNLAQCARRRMTDYCGDINRWRGERISFYTSLRQMNVDDVVFMGG